MQELSCVTLSSDCIVFPAGGGGGFKKSPLYFYLDMWYFCQKCQKVEICPHFAMLLILNLDNETGLWVCKLQPCGIWHCEPLLWNDGRLPLWLSTYTGLLKIPWWVLGTYYCLQNSCCVWIDLHVFYIRLFALPHSLLQLCPLPFALLLFGIKRLWMWKEYFYMNSSVICLNVVSLVCWKLAVQDMFLQLSQAEAEAL